ncbi:MAG TPA: HmuY family protein, partial [Fibrobacteria bacterium]|nr:HmuY family protein [Fibrobacteria bacterium]
LAFRSTTIKVNGSAQIVSANFDTLKTAPTSGYAAGSVGTWYDYAGEPTHLISPQLGKVILIKTVDNKYAKIQVLNYYQGAPAIPNGLTDTPRYYTFRFVLQPDGTTSLQ